MCFVNNYFFYEIIYDYMKYYQWKNGRFSLSLLFLYLLLTFFNTQQY